MVKNIEKFPKKIDLLNVEKYKFLILKPSSKYITNKSTELIKKNFL